MPLAATRIYQMSFFTGFGVSALVYYLLNVAFPVIGASKVFEEIDLSLDEAADEQDGSEYDVKERDVKESASVDVHPAV